MNARLTVCGIPGCPTLCTTRYCDDHRKPMERERSRRRREDRKAGAPTYDSAAWRRFRKAYLRSAGWRCEECGDRPFDTSKMHVHHKVEIRDGGAMFDPANCEARCIPCHNKAHPHRGPKPPPPGPPGGGPWVI